MSMCTRPAKSRTDRQGHTDTHQPRITRSARVSGVTKSCAADFHCRMFGHELKVPVDGAFLHGSHQAVVAKAQGHHLTVTETIALGHDMFGRDIRTISRRTPPVVGRNKKIARSINGCRL